MEIKVAKFITSASKKKEYPQIKHPELSFSGRSNVGKSSLINALVNRNNLAKISSSPGRTRLINFFLINNLFFFVDLPGYGYAKVPSHIKKKWQSLIQDYFIRNINLIANFIIIDARRNSQKRELEFIKWLKIYQVPVIIVITKIDKISKNLRQKQLRLISNNLNCNKEELILISSKTKEGIDFLWKKIQFFLEKNFNDTIIPK